MHQTLFKIKCQKPFLITFGSFFISSTANYNKVMITNGFSSSSTRKTEILNLANGYICSDLSDFPSSYLIGSVGGNLNGTPILCGGTSYGFSKICYRFNNDVWEEFTSMKEKRTSAAGVIYNKKLHIFGGWDGSKLQTSEIIDVDGGVSDGPDLPLALSGHAMTSINNTVSIISGGTPSENKFKYMKSRAIYNPDLLNFQKLTVYLPF